MEQGACYNCGIMIYLEINEWELIDGVLHCKDCANKKKEE